MPKKSIAITFLIPTYGGLNLLKKNLPTVLSEMEAGDELLISEDAADNLENLRYFTRKYNLQLIPDKNKNGKLYRARIMHEGKPITISFFQRRFNGRFARNVNDAVKLIDHSYFILLNNDVRLRPGVRDRLLNMIRQNVNTFAVTAKEIDVNDGGSAGGRNKLWWARGRFWHDRDPNLSESGPTAWACGGSSIYDIDKWEVLGGFDTLYYPAYWEDIDLSFAARRRGWQVLYCPKAIVDHVHETTNQTVFGEEKIKAMSWHNGTKFAWKNAHGWQKLEFLFYHFYWQLKQFPALKLWLFVILLAVFTRFAFLNIPHGLTVDEAAIAYNGRAVISSHRDEWLNFMPVTFRSFGDYKAPLAIYLSGIITSIFGMSIWSIRLPFALAGIGSIIIMMKLIDLLLQEKSPRHHTYAAIGGLFMALVPWHYHFSHLGFETNYALFFQLTAVYLIIKNLRSDVNKRGLPWNSRYWSPDLFWATICLVISMYAYHSAKLTVPLILLFTLLYAGKKVFARSRTLIIPVCASIFLLLPMFQDSFCEVSPDRPFTLLAWGQSISGKPAWRGGFCGDGTFTGKGLGMTRGDSSFLFDPDLSSSEKQTLFNDHLTTYLGNDFLYNGQLDTANIYNQQKVANIRHGDSLEGVLYWIQLPLFMILLITIICQPHWRRQYWRLCLLGVTISAVGFVPAAITNQIPHANQALSALPGFILLTSLSILAWRQWWDERAVYYPSCVMLVLVLMGIEFAHFQKNYLTIYHPVTQIGTVNNHLDSTSRNTQLNISTSFLFATNLLDAFHAASSERSNVKQIIYAGQLEQPYIYALLAETFSPEQYRYGKLGEKYLFLDHLNEGEITKANTIIIYSPLEIESLEPWERDLTKKLLDENCAETIHYYFGPLNNLNLCRTKDIIIELNTESESDNGTQVAM